MARKNVTEQLAPTDEGLARAAQILEAGGLVAVPTETVYGLAARADSAEAVAGIYAAKGRPSFNPLIVHVKDLDQAERLALFDERARDLARRFWPGPLTLVLPMREDAKLAKAVSAGLPTIALRNPAHPVMQALLDRIDFPLAAPSANRSEEVSPTRAEHVIASLGERCPAVIAGGPTKAGLESTIIALRGERRLGGGWNLLRPGPITREALEQVLGPETSHEKDKVEAPGQTPRHYSPGKPLRLNAQEVARDEFFIGFGEIAGDCTLSPQGDLSAAAANLYDCLHQAAASHRPRIAVAPIPESGIGQAINDRLKRAATRS
ncbi:L-threonylcarbamoyladenylate synthase [Qipengyuania sp. S6317L1]|uniref:L-threonylcarbamoyladenylate synthase n=1 Tax=Qipengyuania sp. S6317L1 TaxID=2926410 RepID=UPI001FF42CE4|nr:L-threonylcarbamoyladenylate synthase [Qipengyuania sp. S6317L1]MCK0099075.1 L-threonylcarbamoyladenylate synthase [Qipengyuania sp. S6317L1]